MCAQIFSFLFYGPTITDKVVKMAVFGTSGVSLTLFGAQLTIFFVKKSTFSELLVHDFNALIFCYLCLVYDYEVFEVYVTSKFAKICFYLRFAKLFLTKIQKKYFYDG